jgi:4a-hydroxytetrahydrobiopterin dehydratase
LIGKSPPRLRLRSPLGYVAEAAGHYPDLSIGYAQVTMKLQTHRVRGITPSDLELARRIDEVALWKPAEGSPLGGFPKRWTH